MTEYLKSVALAFVSLLIQLILFFVCFCGGTRGQTEEDTFIKLGIAAAAAAIGYALTRPSFVRKGGRTYLLVVAGSALLVGGIVAGISPLVTSVTYLLGMADGFFMCLIAWFFLTLLAAASVGLAVAMAKLAVQSLLKLDFYIIFYCLMLFCTGIYAMIQCLSTAMSIHPLVGFGSFISIAGGGLLGAKAPAIEEQGVVYDAEGNPHYVVGTLSSNRRLCTDGHVWRREADGRFSQLNA